MAQSVEFYGTLTVRVTAADGALPIMGATVNIIGADNQNRDYYKTQTTNEDGNTPIIVLPTPSPESTLTPNGFQNGYSSFDVDVYAKDYYRKKIYSVSVFSGIDSSLPVSLVPYSRFNAKENVPNGNSLDIDGGISGGKPND